MHQVEVVVSLAYKHEMAPVLFVAVALLAVVRVEVCGRVCFCHARPAACSLRPTGCALVGRQQKGYHNWQVSVLEGKKMRLAGPTGVLHAALAR